VNVVSYCAATVFTTSGVLDVFCRLEDSALSWPWAKEREYLAGTGVLERERYE
jgi:hypothetical protein